MTKVSSMTRDMSMRECPECGSKNGLRTQRMLEEGNRALKECHGCGYECVVDYDNHKLLELDEVEL